MVYSEVRVGLYERLVEHLFLLVGHIRYEQAEEGHELLYLAREKLHGEGLARARGAEQYEIRVLVHLRVKEVDDAQRVIVAVHAQQHAGVVGHLKARE